MLNVCLNPYSNGILTDTSKPKNMKTRVVLILILMEYSQTAFSGASEPTVDVLILILMEYSQTFGLEFRSNTTS